MCSIASPSARFVTNDGLPSATPERVTPAASWSVGGTSATFGACMPQRRDLLLLLLVASLAGASRAHSQEPPTPAVDPRVADGLARLRAATRPFRSLDSAV